MARRVHTVTPGCWSDMFDLQIEKSKDDPTVFSEGWGHKQDLDDFRLTHLFVGEDTLL